MDGARIAVLLVSSNFLASEYVTSVELPYLLKRRKRGMAVLWLPISASLYERTPLKEIQAAADPHKPLDRLARARQQEVLVAFAKRVSEAMDMNGLAGVFRLADRFAPQQDAYLANKRAPKDEVLHGVMAKQDGEQIRFVAQRGTPPSEFKVAHLKQLDPKERQLIRTYERVMDQLFDQWSELEPKCYARSAAVRDKARSESEEVRRQLCGQLSKILKFIERVHGQLADHYGHVRHVCEQQSGTNARRPGR